MLTNKILAVATMLLGGAITASTIIPQSLVGQEAECGDPESRHARGFIAYARSMLGMERSTPARERLGLPRLDASAVVLVTDSAICTKAAQAIVRTGGGVLPANVYIIQAGEVWWVEDPMRKVGEYINGMIFDSTFARVLSHVGR